MNFIIYDLELNSKPFKSNLPNEIIEIGAVMLDNDLNQVDEFHSFIKPKYFKKLFPIVKKKTSIRQEDIDTANLFNEIILLFREWIGEEYVLISWGHDDIHHLCQNCKYNRIKTDWLNMNIDMQKQFSSIYNLAQGQRLSLENALKLCEIQLVDDLHRALVDAQYTSKIFTTVYPSLDLELYSSIKVKSKHKYKPNAIKTI